jgi:hypothetical protein
LYAGTQPFLEQKKFQTLAYNVAIHRPFRALVVTTSAGARSQFQSCLLPLSLLAARHLRYSVDKCATQLASFLPQALLPFCSTQRLTKKNITLHEN